MGKIVYYANSRNADVESAPPGYNTTIAKFISGPSASSSANEPSAPPDEGSYSYQQQQQPLNIQQPTNYLTIPTPANPQYVMRYIIKSKNGNDRHFPVNAAIFLLGFLFPPLWVIGCCWTSRNRYEVAWRKLNICMTILSLLVFIVFTIIMTILILEESEQAPRTPPTGDLPNLPPF